MWPQDASHPPQKKRAIFARFLSMASRSKQQRGRINFVQFHVRLSAGIELCLILLLTG